MSANVERMMYVREAPWHGIGTCVQEAPTSADALRIAGLDWTVEQRPVYRADGSEINPFVENYRSDNGRTLGIVTTKYRICQNTEAFAFTDALIGGEVRYDTAGSLRNGKQIWLLAKLEGTQYVGDEFENYIVFTNTHDGSGAIRCAMTPVRVVCQNTLNLALDNADRAWSTIHKGDIMGKLAEAENVLFKAHKYMEEYAGYAEQLANTPLKMEDLELMLTYLFPYKETDSDTKKRNAQELRSNYMACYFMPDLVKFRGTQWGAINAMSDFVTHTEPQRKTKDYRANRWGKVMNGHQLMDNLMQLMSVKK